ncbi:MAG: alkane 1-monooxygenase [Flavobacteriaceae bacterium]|nr:alkane 1-monooxygenase [Cryomorphaceae bacterium]MBL6677837.1 alkane 1-monooxygenase [Flavobacteriaceae bacterium]MDA0331110.1 alkane 1-monooxygenase [Bacteroidota bacterium]
MKDLKYLMSYSIAIMAFLGISIGGLYNYLAVIFTFVFIPVLEVLVKRSDEKYTEQEKENRLLDPFFDILLYLNIPIVFGIFFFSLNKLVETTSISDIIGIILSASIVMATNGINVGHELGHRRSLFARTCSKLLYLPCQYMHFYIEHNFGHHIHVATPEDPATAMYKQNIYSFWITSVVRTYISAWKIQLRLLKVSKRSFFSIKNDMIFYTLLQLSFIAMIYNYFELYITLLSILISVISFLFLETINYVEHYGLLRKKDSNGRYERVKPHHSWNSNHTIGRIVLYELTRHSDHHFKSSKKYQVLESLDNCPHLPYGYPTSILLSLIPPIWFSIMNPLVRDHMGYSD